MESKYPAVGGFNQLGSTIFWSPRSAPSGFGGIEADSFSVLITDSKGDLVVPLFKTKENLLEISVLKPITPFKEKEKYYVSIAPHFKDGDGERAAFEIVFDDLSELNTPVVDNNPVQASNPSQNIPPDAPVAPNPKPSLTQKVDELTVQVKAQISGQVVNPDPVKQPATKSSDSTTKAQAQVVTPAVSTAKPAVSQVQPVAQPAKAQAPAQPAASVIANPAQTAQPAAQVQPAAAQAVVHPVATQTTNRARTTNRWLRNHWKRIVIAVVVILVLGFIWPITKWIMANNSSSTSAGNNLALDQEVSRLRNQIETLLHERTNQMANLKDATKSEWPEINGIKGNSNNNNNVVMVRGSLSVTIGSHNGTPSVNTTVDAVTSAVMIPGGLPPGCTKVRLIEFDKVLLENGKVTRLPTINILPGEYIRVIVPPGWSVKGDWYSSGKVNTSTNGRPCNSVQVTDQYGQQPRGSELGYWLESGTTSADLVLSLYK